MEESSTKELAFFKGLGLLPADVLTHDSDVMKVDGNANFRRPIVIEKIKDAGIDQSYMALVEA